MLLFYSSPAGIIPVKDIVEVRDATALSIDWPSDAAAETCFGVVTRSRTYFFVAEDKMQADLWVDQLLKVRCVALYCIVLYYVVCCVVWFKIYHICYGHFYMIPFVFK